MINDQKTPMILKVHSHDEVSNYETEFGEWKIQLKIAINFIFLKILKKLVLCIKIVIT